MTKYSTVDEYIHAQPSDIASRLSTIRNLFHEVVPDTKESISYDMPAFTVGTHRLYIGAYNTHIGMYPMYGGSELDEQMLPYRGSGTKNALHFRHSEELPIDLIRAIITSEHRKQ